MKLFHRAMPLVLLFVLACQKVPEDNIADDPSGAEVNEFSYQEVAAAAEAQRSKTVDSAKLKSSSADGSGDTKPVLSMRDGPEVCTALSTQRCVSCCEDFFMAGTKSWDRCVEACMSGTTTESIKEY